MTELQPKSIRLHSIETSDLVEIRGNIDRMATEGVISYPKLKSDSSAVSAASATSGVSETSDENRMTPPPIGIQITNSIIRERSALSVRIGDSGRIKAPPVCVSAVLQNKAMTQMQLNDLIFPVTDSEVSRDSHSKDACTVAVDVRVEDCSTLPIISSHPIGDMGSLPPIPASVSVVASTSSCGASTGSLTRDYDVANLSDSETKPANSNSYFRNFRESEKLNAKVVQQKGSRQGRASQRWVTPHDNTASEPIRLVVGTVPILKGGKILFVSASRKPEWILPKGGWEGDESMEESAIRESFEEAGVVGILGKALSPIQYETRKSKKRRLEIEDLNQQLPLKSDDFTSLSSLKSSSSDVVTPTQEYEPADGQVTSSVKTEPLDDRTDSPPSGSNQPTGFLSAEELARIRSLYQTTGKHTDETMSVGSTFSSSYSFVKMTLFPLYVTNVMDVWPESGRLRTAVDIDVAIEMMDTRPEFRAVLKEVKALGLHLSSAVTLMSDSNDDLML